MTVRLIVTRNEFAKLAAGLAPKAEALVLKTAYDIEAGYKERAPVKTGNLRRSIHTVPLGATSASVGTDVEYSRYVEFGTRHMAARPALVPSVEANRAPFQAGLQKLLAA